jgi:hypothetical protein
MGRDRSPLTAMARLIVDCSVLFWMNVLDHGYESIASVKKNENVLQNYGTIGRRINRRLAKFHQKLRLV